MPAVACALLLLTQDPAADALAAATANAAQSRRAVAFCLRYADGWLRHADPRSGLLPRTLKGDAYWNAKDCAADNFPFLWLTGRMTGQPHLVRAGDFLLQQERRLTSRLDDLPDDFVFATQSFRPGEPKLDGLIFGAAEYCKDGLLPMIEWAGHGPWTDRFLQLLRAIAAHAEVDSPAGRLPSSVLEVNGDLLQACSRAGWMTGDPRLVDLAFRLGDHYLLHAPLLAADKLPLRDHGCEVIGGLAEAYALCRHLDPERAARWKEPLRALLDCVLQHGVRDDGLLHDAIDPRSGKPVGQSASDGWGYVLDAVLAVADVDGVGSFRDAVRACLQRVTAADCAATPGLGGADGCADTLEGALNLLQRLPEPATLAWVDRQIEILFRAQRPDGILEAWYGDGNSARTMWMWALSKTLGITASPWREDLALGAARAQDGKVHVVLQAEFAWSGELRFDRPRHADWLGMPQDLARINQWPEWWPIGRHDRWRLENGGTVNAATGAELWRLPLALKPGGTAHLILSPDAGPSPLREQAYRRGSADEAMRWQTALRADLRALLEVADLDGAAIPLAARTVSSSPRDDFVEQETELQSTPGRRIRALLTIPSHGAPPFPAVVCIHGHGGTRHSVHDPRSLYRGFAAELARQGFVTVACDVGQHEVQEPGRTLLGERLQDLQRCVDLLLHQGNVDAARIGCAGLSLGGEMAMWLGALDPRIAATVSCGFLTTMDQLEQGHCLCWKLDGLRERVDFADVYALIAPRWLQCQNGFAEPPTDFCVPLARRALADVRCAYEDLGAGERVALHVHDGGHVVDVPALVAFLREHLGAR
jgi:hypothetical protein